MIGRCWISTINQQQQGLRKQLGKIGHTIWKSIKIKLYIEAMPCLQWALKNVLWLPYLLISKNIMRHWASSNFLRFLLDNSRHQFWTSGWWLWWTRHHWKIKSYSETSHHPPYSCCTPWYSPVLNNKLVALIVWQGILWMIVSRIKV